MVEQNLTRPEGGIWIPVIGCWNQVESAYSLGDCSTQKSSRLIRRRRREGFCCLFYFFYDLVAGKYALIFVHIFSGFA